MTKLSLTESLLVLALVLALITGLSQWYRSSLLRVTEETVSRINR